VLWYCPTGGRGTFENCVTAVLCSHYASGYHAAFHVNQFRLEPPLSEENAEALLPALVALHEQHNVYPDHPRMMHHVVTTSRGFQALEAKTVKTLTDWNRLWKLRDTGSVEDTVRFEGGDLLNRAESAVEKLSAVDFRLRPDSADYRAGKDLGADVDLVGPGKAYERWKKTPEYQQWLKDTGQVKK
jgi:hypothetical protein